jgi:hypothetical protein
MLYVTKMIYYYILDSQKGESMTINKNLMYIAKENFRSYIFYSP